MPNPGVEIGISEQRFLHAPSEPNGCRKVSNRRPADPRPVRPGKATLPRPLPNLHVTEPPVGSFLHRSSGIST